MKRVIISEIILVAPYWLVKEKAFIKNMYGKNVRKNSIPKFQETSS